MKLKRFLLRYDPPGIGVECLTSSGETDVTHIDVPDHVQSQAEIKQFAKETIAASAILKESKHLQALVSILGRLRHVEINDGGEEEPSELQRPINVGDTIVLVGLKDKDKDECRAQFNGELAEVTKAKPEKEKYEVVTASGKELSVKSKNIVPTKEGKLIAGAHVMIRGLRNHIELNGCSGRIVECLEQAHRYEIRATESGQLFRVKEENLVLIDSDCPQVRAAMAKAGPLKAPAAAAKEGHEAHPPAPSGSGKVKADAVGAGDSGTFKPGSFIRLVGLKTAMAYNGQTAEVLAVDNARSRYEIRLSDGSVKTVRAENVEKF